MTTSTNLHVGDAVIGLGRDGRIWQRKPIGTVVEIRQHLGQTIVHVRWDENGSEVDMDPDDLLPIRWTDTEEPLMLIPHGVTGLGG